ESAASPLACQRVGLTAASRSPYLAGVESAAGEPVDVVGEPDHEQDDDEHESDHARLLDHPVGHAPAPYLLDEAPEHVSSVEWQEGEEVQDRKREAEEGEQGERPAHVLGEAL